MVNPQTLVYIRPSNDPHMALIRSACASMGWNLRELQLGANFVEYSVELSPKRAVLRCGEVEVDDALVSTSILLCLALDVRTPKIASHCRNDFEYREWESSLSSALEILAECCPSAWMIERSALALQNRKPFLWWLADKHGLRVPPWSLGERFSPPDWGRSVGKCINSWQEVEEGRYYSTALITDAIYDSLVAEWTAPGLMQQYIQCMRELRLFMIGERPIAVICFKERHDIIDVRTMDSRDAKWEVAARPEDHCEVDKVKALMCDLGIRYCVFDFALTARGPMLFDVNPAGSWAFLAHDFGLDITSHVLQAMAENGGKNA